MENGNPSRKELTRQYKERTKLGGVYLIRNTLSGKALFDSTADLQGSRNRFEFARKTGSCIDLKLQTDWAAQGGDAFVFETLEELKQGEGQTDAGFKADIALLKEMWLEKLSGEELY